MKTLLPSNPSTAGRVTGGHLDAARIVESLFRVSPTTCWDLLLDLRQALLEGWDTSRMQAIFQRCRSELEKDHYLPFYRLRRLLDRSTTGARDGALLNGKTFVALSEHAF